MIAPGADCFVLASLQKNAYARSTPRPGPGFGSNMKKIERPASAACLIAIGSKMPWLIALFKNSTFAGSMTIAKSGRRLASVAAWAPAESTARITDITGPMNK